MDLFLSTCRLQKAFELVAKCIDIVDNFSSLYQTVPYQMLCHKAYFNIDESDCTESCNYVEYKVTTSYSQFPSSASSISIANEIGVTSERIKNDLVAVDIYFGDPHSRTSSTTNAFTVISLLFYWRTAWFVFGHQHNFIGRTWIII